MRFFIIIFFILHLTLKMSAQSVGGVTSGSTAFCTITNSGFISLTLYTGNILHWESSTNSGVSWTLIANPTATQNYFNLSQTTLFRAIVKSGAFPQDTSTISAITIYEKAKGGNIIGGGAFCLSAPASTLQIVGNIGSVTLWEFSINNGVTWTLISSTLTTLSYAPITQNTNYRAIIQNVVTCPKDTSAIANFSISPASVSGILYQTDTVCSGANYDTLKLSGKVGNVVDWIKSTNLGSSWTSIGNINSIYTYSNSTQTITYAVIVKSGACASATTQPINIVVVNANLANAGADKTIIQYDNIQLDGSGFGIPEWTPNMNLNNQNVFTPLANPLNTITYLLTLTDKYGCESKDSMVLKVIVPIPNAITPNGDGVNDYFLIDKIEDYNQNSLIIFNRWGNIVYKESPYKNNWNGKSRNGNDLPDDVYYYTLDYGNDDKPISGNILIKR